MEFSVFFVYFALFLSLYFEIYVLITYFENKRDILANKKSKNKNYFPSVTIIVPAWNEEDTIAATLKSLLELDYPKDKLKILVVDDGSTDNTAEEVKKYLNFNQIEFLQKENGGKHTAMNYALERVETDLVGSLDADSFVDSQALKYIVLHFKNSRVASVTSVIKTFDGKGVWANLQKSEFVLSAFIRKIFSLSGSVFITPGPFSIMRTSVVKELGGWKKAHNTEDMEIGVRLQINHYIIENEERAIIYTKPLSTFKALYKQRLRWLYGFLKNSWDYRKIFFNREYGNLGLFVLPFSFFAVIASVILFILFIYKVVESFIEWIIKISVVGLDWPKSFSFDLFYFDINSLLIIILIMIILMIFSLSISKKMIGEKKIFTKDVWIYLILYGVVAPTWLTAAVLKVIFRQESKWEDN